MKQQEMTDVILINDLVVSCILGVFTHERTDKQQVIISLKLFVDISKAAQTDDLNDTVSYHDIVNIVYAMVNKSQYFLLEKLAQEIANLCLGKKGVKQITVHIEKPNALRLAKSAAIEITRTNE